MTDVSLAATGHAGAEHCEAPASPSQPDPGPRRHLRSACEKARIASESFVPGASVSAVAMRHGVDASTLSKWRGQAMRGELGLVPGVPAVPAVVPVVVDEGADSLPPATVAGAGSHRSQRRWPFSEKVRIVAESFAPGGSLRSAARRHGVARSTLSEWRALAREGELGPVPEVAAPTAGTPATDTDTPTARRIEGRTAAPSASVTVEAGEAVVRLPWDCPVERIVAVASGLERAR